MAAVIQALSNPNCSYFQGLIVKRENKVTERKMGNKVYRKESVPPVITCETINNL